MADQKLAMSSALMLALVAALTGPSPAMAQDGGSGGFTAIMESDPGLETHTIYRPASLAPFGPERRMPVVSWGNGGCANAGDSARNFLTEIASHGMFVIAVGPIADGVTPERQPAPAAEPGTPPAFASPTRAEQLTEAIDWALAENQRQDSRYFGRLAPDAIALMGYSCGGLQALSGALDPRVKTLMLLNSGVLPEDARRPGMDVGKEILDELSIPVAYIAGGPSDIAYLNSVDDVGRIDDVPVFFGNIDVGHGGTYREPNGGEYGMVASDWLGWHLLGDQTAARTFVGTDCRLCTDPEWTVEKKNID